MDYGLEPVGDVFFCRSRDGFLVSLAQRLKQLAMLEEACLGTAFRGQCQVPGKGPPHGVNSVGEGGETATLIEEKVEGSIEISSHLRIGGGRGLLSKILRLGKVPAREVEHSAAHGIALNQPSHDVGRRHLIKADTGYPHPSLGFADKQALGFQLSERLADWGDTGAEVIGEAILQESAAPRSLS